jgi:subtilisin family serine protease
MKRAALVALLFIVPFPIFAATTRSVLVALRPAGKSAMKTFAAGVDVTTPGHNFVELSLVNGFAADLSEDEISALKKSPEVLFVEDDKPRYAIGLHARSAEASSAATATAATQMHPYGIDLVHAPQAWTAGRGASVNVAVIDTGIDYTHPELKDAYTGGYNTFTQGADAMDDNGHGTHCSGTIAAADNNVGVVGIAPLVHLFGVKVLDKDGNGKTSNVIAGINWVVQKKTEVGGRWVASLSLGSCSSSILEQQAFDRAAAAGVLVFAAAGNHDPSKPEVCSDTENNLYSVSYPAAYPSVAAVAAVDAASKVASFSNFGPEVALSAPGVDVLSTVPVGTGDIFSSVVSDGTVSSRALAFDGSPSTSVTASYVFCNLGNTGEFPASVSGKVAIIRRGELTFHDKAQNAKKAGAIGMVVINSSGDLFHGTLIGSDPADASFAWPPSLLVSPADGQYLLDHPSAKVALSFGTVQDDYAFESGTSMACPHAAGVAAAVWSIAPNATAQEIKQGLSSTAHDLGDPGVDNNYGHGLIDAYAAAINLNPNAFGSGITPITGPVTGRLPGRRGH